MADRPFHLRVPAPSLLSQSQELAFARAAFERSPGSAELRVQLAGQLIQADAIDDAISLLQGAPAELPMHVNLLLRGLLSRDADDDMSAALPLAERQLARSRKPGTLTQAARVLLRLGQTARAAEMLEEALTADPHHKEALKRLTMLDLRRDQAAEALARIERLHAQGVRHPYLFSSWQLALAQLGRIERAHAAQGLDECLASFTPEPPPGYPTLEAFNQVLAREILAHPDARQERRRVGTNKTWVIDQPALRNLPGIAALRQLIGEQVTAYVAAHPSLEYVPAHTWLRNWCVMAEGAGHEDWHVHQSGWLSGVYYIHVQDHIAQGTGPGGCFAFGIPGKLVGEPAAEAFGQRLVRPHSGLMMIFPSHAYHRTYPHGGEGRRICFSFDINPEQPPA